MNILALDTATEGCSVALYHDGKISSKAVELSRRHADLILPMIEQLLVDAKIKLTNLDFIAFGRGPGAFTGVRIAASVAQGLAFGIDCPVIPISNLAAIAQGAYRKYQAKQVISCIDARMHEIYVASFVMQNGEMIEYTAEQVIAPSNFHFSNVQQNFTDDWIGAGRGFQAYPNFLPNLKSKDINLLPHALDILELAQFAIKREEYVSAENALPVYLRNNVATPKQVI